MKDGRFTTTMQPTVKTVPVTHDVSNYQPNVLRQMLLGAGFSKGAKFLATLETVLILKNTSRNSKEERLLRYCPVLKIKTEVLEEGTGDLDLPDDVWLSEEIQIPVHLGPGYYSFQNIYISIAIKNDTEYIFIGPSTQTVWELIKPI